MRPASLASLGLLGLLALAPLACSATPPADDGAASSEDSLRALSPAEILGELHYGETKGPFAYTRRPRLRGFWFQGSSGDEIDVKATSTAGAATVLVADDAFHDLPGGAHTTLTKAGKYWIAVRDSQLLDAQLTVTLTRTNTASQTIADVAVGPYGTCALLGGAGGVRCWGLTASDYFSYPNFNSGTSKTPANAMPASHHFLPSHRHLAFDGVAGSGSWQTAIESAQNNYGTPLVYGEAFFKSLDPADPGARPLALLSDECAWFAGGRVRCTSGYSTYSIKDFDFGGETFLAGAVGSTRSFACAITPARALKCWGGNAYGRLGTGDNLSRGVGDPDQDAHADLTLLAPVNLGAGATVTAAALGDNHACALLANGSVKCWGAGASGQLGRVIAGNVGVLPGDMGDALPVVALGGAGGGAAPRAKGVFAFDDATCVALADGHLRCFGALPYPLVSEMAFDKPVKKLVVSGRGTQYAADAPHACALLEDDSLRCWGSNTFGALGLPSAITSLAYDANVGAGSLVAIAVP